MPHFNFTIVDQAHSDENHTFLVDLFLLSVRPKWEQLFSVWIFLRSLDRAFSTVEHFIHSVHPTSSFAGARCRKNARALLYLFCCSLMCAIILPVPFVYESSLIHWLLASSIFLTIVDSEILLTPWQISTTSWTSIADRISSSYTFRRPCVGRSLLQHVFSVDKGVNFFLKLSVSCFFATSGYSFLDKICRILVVQQLFYMLCSLFFIPLMLAFDLRLLRVPTKCCIRCRDALPSSASVRTSRTRSLSLSSCHTNYPERLHVDVQSMPHPRGVSTHPSSVHLRIKYLTLFGLLLLCIHNYYIFRMTEERPFSVLLSTLLCSSDHHPLRRLALQRFLFSFFFNKPNLNLLFFLLTWILFYYRVKGFSPPQAELLNFDVLTKHIEKDVLAVQDDSSTGALIHTEDTSNTTFEHPVITDESITPTTNLDEDLGVGQLLDLDDCDKRLLHQLSLGQLKTRDLEILTDSPAKAVELRRIDLCRLLSNPHVIDRLPFRGYDYRFVCGQCCEEVIGYVPIPVGKVGPLLLDGRSHYLPLATTEGCLVASTNRGCRALFLAGGVKSAVFRDQMTRAPVVWFPSVLQLVECIVWLESVEGFQQLKAVFDRTSSHINLISIFPNPSGHYLHIRFAARTGDAMGMNMVSKATNVALHELRRHFPAMQIISLSGNMCTDKKPASINTILGRGKSVIAETNLPAAVIAQVLHTTAARLAKLAHAKNWTGSAMAGCPGMMGSNAHAANIVAGIFAATGQDLAQVVDASACLTQFEVGQDDSLVASVTMPCLEVGTVGGGTRLPAQRACLDLMSLNVDRPTEHLARLIAGAVLAGELSLMAALDTDDLVSAHLRLNRAPPLGAVGACLDPPKPPGDASLPRDITHATIVKSDASGRLDPPHPIM